MKKSTINKLLFLAFSCVASLASAVDVGAIITNDSKLAGNTFSELLLDQKNTAAGWIRVPFNEKGTTYFTAEGLVQFERVNINLFGVDDADDAYNASAADVDLFKFGTTVETASGKVNFAFGRFFSSDLSGAVFSQNADGLLVGYESPMVNASIYGAYTGLLNGRMVSILDPDFSEDTDKFYQLAAKYMVGALTVSLPNLVANQTLAAQFLGTFRLEDERYNRLYAELAFTGPIVSTVFYNFNTTFGFSSYDGGDFDVSNLTKGGITWYAPANSLAIGINGVYASGAQGSLTSFQGFTSQTAVNALSGRTEYADLLKAGIALSVKPVANVLLGATGDLIFDTADSVSYEGFQYGANINWQIVSDVSVGLVAYQYYNTDDSSRDKSCVQLKAAISF